MGNSECIQAAPIAANRTVPLRIANTELRSREYLTSEEVDKLMAATGDNRYGPRDRAMILLAYRHGLRASELVNLEWIQINLRQAQMHVRRVKNGINTVHPLRADELRLLGKLKTQSEGAALVFISERGTPISTAGFARMLQRVAERAGLSALRIHPHMLRHGCGFALVSQNQQQRAIQHYLGHKNPAHTVRYTALSPEPYREFWRD